LDQEVYLAGAGPNVAGNESCAAGGKELGCQ
jgi:hypothetical protein